jgi:hypothetical protein
MEHDLIQIILNEKITEGRLVLERYQEEVKCAEDKISLPIEFRDNGYTNSYFVCESNSEKIPVIETLWCETNIGYSPICLFIERWGKRDSRHSDSDYRRMIVLFKNDEDLIAYKLQFSK